MMIKYFVQYGEQRRVWDHGLLTNRNAHSRDMVRATAEKLCNHGQTQCRYLATVAWGWQ